MFAPQMVKCLENHRFLHIGHDFGAKPLGSFVGQIVGRLEDPGVDVIFGDAFLRGPFLDRQVEVEVGRPS